MFFQNKNIKVSDRNENIAILCGQLKGTINNVSVSGIVTAEKSVNVGGACGYVSAVGSYTLEIILNNASVTGLSCVEAAWVRCMIISLMVLMHILLFLQTSRMTEQYAP